MNLPISDLLDKAQSRTIQIIGYGALGRATLKAMATALARHTTRAEFQKFRFRVYDPNLDECFGAHEQVTVPSDTFHYRRRKGAIANVTWHNMDARELLTSADLLVICLPTKVLLEYLWDARLMGSTTVLIRTTAPIDLMEQLAAIPMSQYEMKSLAYVPEYAQEHRLQSGLSKTELFWANSDTALNWVRFAFPNGSDMSRVPTYKEAALNKHLNNALLATLYNFNNEAAVLYRALMIDSPFALPAIDNAGELLIREPKNTPLSYGGKCLDLSTNAVANLSNSLGHVSTVGVTGSHNRYRTNVYAKQVLSFIEAHAKRNRRLDKKCFIHGSNSHVDRPYSKDPNSTLSHILDNNPHDFAPYTEGDPLKPKPIPYLWFLMPTTQCMNIIEHVMRGNRHLGRKFLTVIDTQRQITPDNIQVLNRLAHGLSMTLTIKQDLP